MTEATHPRLPPVLASRFVVEREIGRGGMATVYLARETKHERYVAVKVLHPEVSAAFGAERFLREIGIAARLAHPHLVPLIDSGESDGTLFYVSAYVPGGSLRDRLEREGKLPVDDAVRIAEEVCTGLDFAHRAGFIHRDVKPENILFADGHALLSDFGVARACEVEPDDKVTIPGIALGTPAYMSPEQAAGEDECDSRSDVYSLACVLFEMLAGEPPFTGKSVRSVMAKHVVEPARRLRKLRPEVPESVDAAVARALEKDPEHRIASAAEFAAALKADRRIHPRLFHEEPEPPRRTSNARAYRLFLKGRYDMNLRTQAGITSAINYFRQAIEEDPAYASAYAGLADAYALELDYRSVPVREGFDQAREYATRAIALDPTLAEPHASLGWRYFIYDWDWKKAEEEFRRALELNPRCAWAHQLFGFVLAARGMHGDSFVQGHAAVELDPGSVSARRSLGWLYYYARRWENARHHLELAIAMNPNSEETYRIFGQTLAVEGDFAEAERVLRETVEMPEAGSYSRATLGYALARGGKEGEAREILKALLAESERGYVSPVAIAMLHTGLGNIEQALDWTERAHAERRGWMCYLRVNPLLDPLRGHPRFEDIVGRMAGNRLRE